MPDLADGESFFMQGSGAKPYELKNVGGVYSCNCPAWRNQSVAIEKRTCKHLRKLRGDAAEEARIGGAIPLKAPRTGAAEEKEGPPVLLAESWDCVTDLSGWWMSEKLDGVRAYWDGTQFLSRQGNRYHAPDWFVAGLPPTPLDGELWLARKAFQRTVSIARRQDRSDHWKELRFLIFDAPTHDAPFEERVQIVADQLARLKPAFALAHAHERCKGVVHLREELTRVEALGGEGLMLRQPASRYQAGRSATLLKVKTFHDAEARVLEHQAGAGRHKGRLGALFVEMAGGVRFSIGTGFSDAERENPPPVGSIVTFRYQELTDGGVPRFPSFVGVRKEVPAPTPAPPTPPARTKQTAAPSAVAPTPTRHFIFVAGKSSKFWEIAVQGNEMTTCWGRTGTAGQSKTKTFKDEASARAAAAKLIAEKEESGYIEMAQY
jgi:DNA ligase-1